jgi:peptide deformylase
MILEITKCGHPILRTKGQPVAQVTPALRQLAANMLETMYAADGVGLAAQQVGYALQLAVIDVGRAEAPSELRLAGRTMDVAAHMPLILLNPTITRLEGEQLGPEGCLSVPQVTADIRRAARVWVTAGDLDGKPTELEATGLLARALQHEIDHLNGILFMDRMDPATRASLDGKIKKIQKETQTALKDAGKRAPALARIL